MWLPLLVMVLGFYCFAGFDCPAAYAQRNTAAGNERSLGE